MKIIVADSSTLITLLDTNHFDLLFDIFDQILITDEVYIEISCKNLHKDTIEKQIKRNKIHRQTIEYDEFYEMLIKRLDKGEAESIVLAKRSGLPILIDEKKGRATAKSLGISIIGLVGIILKLLNTQMISKEKAIKIVSDVELNNFRLSNALKRLILEY